MYGEEAYLTREQLDKEALRLGLERVPTLLSGMVTIPMLEELFNTQSVLGGTKIEGVVVKPQERNIFGVDKKLLIGKWVRPEFKEIHAREWKIGNPTNGDILLQLATRYGTHARWEKAVQHLRDDGRLVNAPQDIGLLIKEIPVDVRKECEEEIRELLFNWAWPHIERGCKVGFPEWYKERLRVQGVSE
jgi:hypothetical protein